MPTRGSAGRHTTACSSQPVAALAAPTDLAGATEPLLPGVAHRGVAHRGVESHCRLCGSTDASPAIPELRHPASGAPYPPVADGTPGPDTGMAGGADGSSQALAEQALQSLGNLGLSW